MQLQVKKLQAFLQKEGKPINNTIDILKSYTAEEIIEELEIRDEEIERLEQQCSLHKIRYQRMITQDKLAYVILSVIGVLTLTATVSSFLGINNSGLNLIKDITLMLLSAFTTAIGAIYQVKKSDDFIAKETRYRS